MEIPQMYASILSGFIPCEGYDGYFVDKDGNVVRINAKGTLKSVKWLPSFRTYAVVQIRRNNESKPRQIHVYALIERAFGKEEALRWRNHRQDLYLTQNRRYPFPR